MKPSQTTKDFVRITGRSVCLMNTTFNVLLLGFFCFINVLVCNLDRLGLDKLGRNDEVLQAGEVLLLSVLPKTDAT